MSVAIVDEESKESIWGGGTSPMGASYGKLMMWFFLLSDAFTFTGLLLAYGYQRFKHVPDLLNGVKEWPIPDDIFNSFPFKDLFMNPSHGAPLVFVGIMTFILIMSSVTMVLAVEAGHRMDKAAVEKWMLWTIGGGIAFLGCQAWEWSHFIHGAGVPMIVVQGLGAAHWVDATHTAIKIAGESTLVLEVKDFAIREINGKQMMEWVQVISPEQLKSTPELLKGALGYNEATGEIGRVSEYVSGASLSSNEYGPQLFADFFFFITGFHGTHVFSGVLINVIIFYNVSNNMYQTRGHYEMVEKVGLYWHFVDLVWVFVFTFFYLL